MASYIFFNAIFEIKTYAKTDLSRWIDSDGYIEVHFFPEHNEYDPNPNVPFHDRVVSRYAIDFYIDIKVPHFKRLFFFANPFLLFGDSRPQLDYNYQFDPIAMNLVYGMGFKIYENLEIRATNSQWLDLGGYLSERLVWSSVSVKYSW